MNTIAWSSVAIALVVIAATGSQAETRTAVFLNHPPTPSGTYDKFLEDHSGVDEATTKIKEEENMYGRLPPFMPPSHSASVMKALDKVPIRARTASLACRHVYEWEGSFGDAIMKHIKGDLEFIKDFQNNLINVLCESQNPRGVVQIPAHHWTPNPRLALEFGFDHEHNPQGDVARLCEALDEYTGTRSLYFRDADSCLHELHESYENDCNGCNDESENEPEKMDHKLRPFEFPVL